MSESVMMDPLLMQQILQGLQGPTGAMAGPAMAPGGGLGGAPPSGMVPPGPPPAAAPAPVGGPPGTGGPMAPPAPPPSVLPTGGGQVPPLGGDGSVSTGGYQPPSMLGRLFGGQGTLTGPGGPPQQPGGINPMLASAMLRGLGPQGPSTPQRPMAPLPVASSPGHGGAGVMPGAMLPGRR